MKIRAVYEIMWQKYDKAKDATDDGILRRMLFACWIINPYRTNVENRVSS